MIVFDLHCADGCDRFEAWFGSGAEFDDQLGEGLVQCPYCGTNQVRKAPMAPHVPRQTGADAGAAFEAVARMQRQLLEDSRWVGPEFTETARAMYLGEIEFERVHGHATLDEARNLLDEGVAVVPLPCPVTPPAQVN